MRALLGAALLTTPMAPPLAFVAPQAIVQVVCFGAKYTSYGTAFRVGPDGQYLSVAHVTSGPNCSINGASLGNTWNDKTADFSMTTGAPGAYLTIDCSGFVRDRKYLAIGYARGGSQTVSLELTGTGIYASNGQAILVGMVPVIPGMSGGAVIDEQTGRVVGTVNAENFESGLSWSVELQRTPVCKGREA